MRLLRNMLLDLNNVAEDYVSFREGLHKTIQEITQKVSAQFAQELDLDRVREYYHKYSDLIHSNPYHHYPSFWQHLFERLLGRILSYDELEAIYELYLDIYKREIKAYPDFLELISQAKKNNLTMGIIANGYGERIYRFLEKYNLVGSFGTIIASGLSPFSKPSREIFSVALFNLETFPVNCVYIGDRPDIDIAGANRLGIWSVRLLRGMTKDVPPGSDDEASDFEANQLTEVLRLPIFNLEERIDSVVIPCGGRGIRMGEVTSTRQKCMIPVNGIPILSRVVSLLRDSGIKKFHFILDYRADDVKSYFGDGSSLGIQLLYHMVQGRSTGEKILSLLADLPEIFLYCHGDILFEPALVHTLLKKAYKNNLHSTFAITKRPTAMTHPVFLVSNGQTRGILRHSTGSTKEDYYYSIGFGLINKKEIPMGRGSEDTGDLTTEQLLHPNASSVVTLEYNQDWFHLETEEDVARFDKFNREYHVY